MLVLLSPAKTLDESPTETVCKRSEPLFTSQTQELVSLLQSQSKAELQQTLAVSANLARYTRTISKTTSPAKYTAAFWLSCGYHEVPVH